MTSTSSAANASALSKGNAALRERNYREATRLYTLALEESPQLRPIILRNIELTSKLERLKAPSEPSDEKARKPILETDQQLASKVARPPTSNARAPEKKQASSIISVKHDFQGYFDRLEETILAGWAIDRFHPGTAVELSIFVDNTHFIDIKTSQPRNDLISKGMPGEIAGFTLNLPVNLFETGTSVDVRYKASGHSLQKSPKTYNSRPRSSVRSNLLYLDAWQTNQIKDVTVIVPIFNAFEAVSACLSALENTVADRTQFLLINDCSTDPRIDNLLNAYALRPRFKVVSNGENLGYTRSINKAIRHCESDDVILLNSDTIVTGRWLQNLRYCAYAYTKVATVTAISDNAGAFSVPEIGTHNEKSPYIPHAEYAQLITDASDGRMLSVPTGNGFCLYIRRSAIDDIGLFDEEKYPRGYGEENDFCMRGLHKGWRHLVCDKAFVFHKRSQSFKDEKIALMKAGAQQIAEDYPEYKLLTQRFHDGEFTYVRYRVRNAIASLRTQTVLPRIMYVISTQTGGTPQTNFDLMLSMRNRYHCFLLRCDAKTITLSELVDGNLEVRETHTLLEPIEPINHRSDEYDRIVLDMLYRHSISLLHIRHIAWHSLGLAPAARSLGIPVAYSIHDFYSLCPSLNLLDEKLKNCSGQCTKGDGTCQSGLWAQGSLPQLKHRFVNRWRDMFRAFIGECDHIITTSSSAANIFLTTYPEAKHKFTVIPHGRNFLDFRPSMPRKDIPDKVKVLVPGNVNEAKGAKLIQQIFELDTENRIEFHFLGNSKSFLKEIGVHHGSYKRSEFGPKVEEIAPHIGVVLSICAETYCHTLTEMWACGIPVIGLDVGAVGERINASGAGWSIPPGTEAKELLARILDAVKDTESFNQRLEAVNTWQKTEGIWNDVQTMSVQYRRIYYSLLGRTREPLKRIGLVLKGQHTRPPTAHIRLLRPLFASKQAHRADIRTINIDWLQAGGMRHVDLLIIQRDAVPADQITPLIATLKHWQLPYIYEVDDPLWDLPEDHTDHAIDEDQKNAVQRLARDATIVTTSTDLLAEELRKFNKCVEVIPNAHDERLWLPPVPADILASVSQTLQTKTDRQRILYMGGASHASDLQMIAPALEEIQRLRRDVELIQIGGGFPIPGATCLNVPETFREYPSFVFWFRAVCSLATIGIAPLRNTRFNTLKSDIKTLDYGLGRTPSVFSNIGPYSKTVVHNETGILCENTVSDWRRSIETLLDNSELREKIATNAFREALNRSVQHRNMDLWGRILSNLLYTQNTSDSQLLSKP